MLIPSLRWRLLVVLLLLAVVALFQGEVALQLSSIFQPDSFQGRVFWQIRLPRVCLVILSGALLGVTGALSQALFRNPLADPSLIGVSAGSALSTVLLLVLVGASVVSIWWLPISGFIGGLLVTALIYRFSQSPSGVSLTVLLLSGIAINAVVLAAISFLQYLSDDLTLRQVVFWMMGGFTDARWSQVWVLLPVMLLMLFGLRKVGQPLNILLLGDQQAEALGVEVFSLQRRLLVLMALGVAAVVSLVGMIGFVGLMVPHLMRLAGGADHRQLLPLSALGGALLLLSADLLARVLLAPAELPVGILTALLGGPFFLFLIHRRRRYHVAD